MNPATVTILLVLVYFVAYVIGRLKGRYIHAGIPLKTLDSRWRVGINFRVVEDKSPRSINKLYSVQFDGDPKCRLIRFLSDEGLEPLTVGYWYHIKENTAVPVKSDTVMVMQGVMSPVEKNTGNQD